MVVFLAVVFSGGGDFLVVVFLAVVSSGGVFFLIMDFLGGGLVWFLNGGKFGKLAAKVLVGQFGS